MKSFETARFAVGTAVLAALGCAAPASAQVPFRHEYAVKVVCGALDRGNDRGLARGRYFTVVNIHAPGARRTYFRRKVAQAAASSPAPVSDWELGTLEYDEAIAVNCDQITKQIDADFAEGFVVIQSSKPLDVVAVYTTEGRDESVNSFHTERVPSRALP